MTGTHKRCRFLEPTDWTSQMRAVNGEHLKLLSFDAPHPTGNLSRWTIPGMGVWITVLCEAGLVLRKLSTWPEGNPGFKRTCTSEAGER